MIDWAPAEGEGDKILFVFRGSLATGQLDEIVFADGELAEVRFVSPGDLDEYAIARLTRRLSVALDAPKAGPDSKSKFQPNLALPDLPKAIRQVAENSRCLEG